MSVFCRKSDIKCLFHFRKSLNLSRTLSAQTAVKSDDRKQHELIEAKPYESIPTLTRFETIRRFFPGGLIDFNLNNDRNLYWRLFTGKYYKIDIVDLHKSIISEFGDIMKMQGMLGKPDMLMCYNPVDFETVLRNDGIHPQRPAFQTLDYYRKSVRPEIFGEYSGLLSEHGESWHKFRSLVNPVVVKPQTVKLYVPQVDAIAKDFIELWVSNYYLQV